jgi:A/G-specific adenine glycosylase
VAENTLIHWAARNPRPMPWKGEKDPYKIWLSEIILQQTRVEQGWAYYEKFIRHYPTVLDLAAASEDQVLKDWEGLGYYSRARNLHAAARYMADVLGGQFPDTYEGIRALKGVGDYTAAAIASFAYNLPYAVLDGNVYRVLARRFGITTPIDTPAAKREFTAMAQSLLDKEQPGAYNQAMMDFGALQCTPAQPLCTTCPFQNTCVAFQTGKTAELPVKSKQVAKKERYFLYVIFKNGPQTWIQQRIDKDIWQGLYEFPLLETGFLPADKKEGWALVKKQYFPEMSDTEIPYLTLSKYYRQTLTHRYVNAVFLSVEWPTDISVNIFQNPVFLKWKSVFYDDFRDKFPKPLVINLFFSDKSPTFAF